MNLVTQKDIAKKAGVTQATISLALRNAPGISPSLKKRILTLAGKMGYRPDPYLSGLAAYRNRQRPAHFRGTLAWLSGHPGPKMPDCWLGYLQGATQRADALGYSLYEYKLRAPGMSLARTRKILLSRNTSGILVGPQPEAETELDFDFTGFSAVTIGYSLVKPRLHMVVQQQFRCMGLAFRKLMELGYRRPGLVIDTRQDERTEGHWSAAFASEQRRLPPADRIAVLQEDIIDRDAVLNWRRAQRPDVILAPRAEVHDWLVAAGVAVPKNTGFVLFNVPDGETPYSGISENAHLIGARAVELLIDMIHRGERGVPDVHVALHVAGEWVEGKTVRKQSSRAPRIIARERTS